MTKSISIRELDDLEVKQLLKDSKFSRLKPASCCQCGEKTNFKRRLFQIKGVPKAKRSDDETQGLLRYHFKKNYSIEFIFFKSFDKKFIVDSSACYHCQSTEITYDIQLDDEVISAFAKLSGHSESQILKDLKDISKKLL